ERPVPAELGVVQAGEGVLAAQLAEVERAADELEVIAGVVGLVVVAEALPNAGLLRGELAVKADQVEAVVWVELVGQAAERAPVDVHAAVLELVVEDGAAPRRGPLVRGEDAHAALWHAITA